MTPRSPPARGACLRHLPRGGLRAQERALQVDPQHPVEVLFGQVEELGGVDDAGVVDEDVDATEVRDGVVDQRFARGPVADVGLLVERIAAGGRDRLHDGTAADFVDVGDDDARTGLGEGAGAGRADALRCAGHDGDAISKLHGWLREKVRGIVRQRRRAVLRPAGVRRANPPPRCPRRPACRARAPRPAGAAAARDSIPRPRLPSPREAAPAVPSGSRSPGTD